MVGEFETLKPTKAQLYDYFKNEMNKVKDCVYEKDNNEITDVLIEKYGLLRSNVNVYIDTERKHRVVCLKNSNQIMDLFKEIIGDARPQLVMEELGPTYRKRSEIYCYGCEDPDPDDLDGITTFGTVALMQEGSPAYIGGLRDDDKMIEYGHLNASNLKDIIQIQHLTRNSVGKPIDIQVQRDKQIVNLSVVPQVWDGPGLVGCKLKTRFHIVRVTKFTKISEESNQ